MNNIVLIGFMAVGKTTVGKSLSYLMHYQFVDTDLYIEKKEGRKIAAIFKENGEPYFRELERNVSKELLKNPRKVISTGGGLFMDEVSRALYLKEDFVVFLKLPMDIIYKRLMKNNKRPLAQGETKEALAKRYQQRLPIYRKAHLEVDTIGKTAFAIAKEIKQAYYGWLTKGEQNGKRRNTKKSN